MLSGLAIDYVASYAMPKHVEYSRVIPLHQRPTELSVNKLLCVSVWCFF